MKKWITRFLLAAFIAVSMASTAPTVEGRITQSQLTKVIPNIIYKKVGDQNLTLDLYIPQMSGKKKIPVVVFIHGGAWIFGSKGAIHIHRLSEVRKVLNTRQVAVASINYRTTVRGIFSEAVTNCKDAIRWLRKHADKYRIDTNRIGLWGASAGGHLALMVGLTEDNQFLGVPGLRTFSARVNYIISWYGPTDIAKMAEKSGVGGQIFFRYLCGAFIRAVKLYKKLSPIEYLRKDAPPILLIHGTHDKTVPLEQSKIFYQKGKKLQSQITLIQVENAGHGFRGKGTKPDLYRVQMKTVEFALRHLKLAAKERKVLDRELADPADSVEK